MLIGVVLVGTIVAGVALVVPAGAARHANAASAKKSVQVKFPLPPPNTAQIDVVTIKASAAKGKKLGSLRVRTTNDAQLRTINPSAIYIVQEPSKSRRSATFKVYALIQRFSAARDQTRFATAAEEPTLNADVKVTNAAPGFLFTRRISTITSCDKLGFYDDLFESGAKVVKSSRGTPYFLESARTPSEQTTDPEGVLDGVVAKVWKQLPCPGDSEGYDNGST